MERGRSRYLIGAALLLVATTAAVYATRLSFAPVYLIHDEVNFSLQAIAVAQTGRDLNGRFLPVYFSEPEFIAGRDPMMIYATALALQFLPVSESAVRLPTALIGVLNVVLMLVLVRRLFRNDALALAAAAMLALSPGHFIHSRMALSVLYAVPFVMLWLIGLRGFDESGDRRTLLTAAAALGLGIYGYLAGLVMMPLYLVLTGMFLVERRSSRLFGWAVAGFSLMLIPLVLWHVAHPERYGALLHAYRVGDAAGEGATPGVASLLSYAGVRLRVGDWWSYFNPDYLFLSGDTSLTNSTRHAGLFPIAFAVLMPVGVYRLSRAGGFERLLLIGLATAPLAAILTGTLDLNRYRALCVLPFGVLTATYGLERLWSSPSRVWRWVAAGLLVTMPWQFWGFYQDYMGPYREGSSTWYGSNLRGALVEVISNQGEARQVLVSNRIPYADVYWRFYVQVMRGRDLAPAPTSVDGDTFDPGSASSGALLVAAAGEPWLSALDHAGWHRLATITEPSGTPSFVVYRKS